MTFMIGPEDHTLRKDPAIDAIVLHAPPDSTRRAAAADSPAIARIIHQTYPTSNLPEDFRDAVDAVRTLNPEWEHRLYDDADIERFIESEYPPTVLELYRRIDPRYGAARVDLFRYLVMFRCGGVYLDVKTEVRTPLREILQDDDSFVSAHWRNEPDQVHPGFGKHPRLHWYPPGELQQWHIMAAAGHPFLEAVLRRVLWNIANYNPFNYGVGKLGVINLTGPVPYTEAIVPLLAAHPHRIANSEEALGLGYSVFGDGARHKSLFAHHYSSLSAPIALVSPLVAGTYQMWYGLKQFGIACREQFYALYRLLKRLWRANTTESPGPA